MENNNIKVITNDNFEEIILKSDKTVILDFWAPWCVQCRAMEPVINDITDDFIDKATVAKLNVSTEKDLAAKYGIRSLPTVIIFKDGKEVEKINGVKSKSDLTDIINKYV